MNISPEQAKALVHSGDEVAFLDVREAADYGDGHPLFAVPCPYSRIEAEAARLVPNPAVPVLLIDNGDGIAGAAAERLTACGFRDVRVVKGGVPGWRAAGFGVFAGVNVPSKTFGELLEHEHHPQTIDPRALAAWKAEGRPLHFFDARPPSEYAKMRIPGARCVPNGELAHRLGSILDNETVPIVITCAGRTRGIVGALGLRAAGIKNPVYALENGTQGWALADLPLDRGATADPYPELDTEARAASRDRAARLKQHAGVSFVAAAEAAKMVRATDRTSYVFDMRTQAERAQLPCPAAEPVLGGQLVQSTDLYVGVRHARLLLIDDTGLRGALAALWLSGLGFETHVVALDEETAPPEIVPFRPPFRMPSTPSKVPVAQAIAALKHPGSVLLDLRSSSDFETRHLRGAVWSIRPRLKQELPPGAEVAILFGDRSAVAAAAADLAGEKLRVFWLDAGLDDCAAAGWPLESARMDRANAIDRVWFVHDRHDGNREASRRYLAWETGLVAELDAQERAEFRPVHLRM